MRVIRSQFLAAVMDPTISLSTYSPRPMKPFLDYVDHAAPRAPGRWTTSRPRKGTTLSRGRRGSGCSCREEYKDSLVQVWSEVAVAAKIIRITGGVGE